MMVDYSLICSRVDDGYAKASAMLGPVYQLYRAQGPSHPLATPIASLNMWVTTDAALKGVTPMSFGKPQCYAAVEREGLDVGDYLVGENGTFFVTSVEYPGPVALIYCNRTISLARAQDALQPGANPQRFGTVIKTAQPFMTGWPASVLLLGSGSKMASTGMNLPTDSKLPGVAMILPVTAPDMMFNDVATDDLGRRYTLAAAEFSALGWRLTGELQPAG